MVGWSSTLQILCLIISSLGGMVFSLFKILNTQDWGNFLRVDLVIISEILNRHSDLKDDDYLLFPFIKDRKTLKNKTGKTFSRFSKDLNLYYYKGGTRPLYSIRHTYATEQWKKGTVIEDISKLMNTSPRMVMSVYLGNSDEALIKLHKRIPNNFKVVK